jgi:hypothetical protein
MPPPCPYYPMRNYSMPLPQQNYTFSEHSFHDNSNLSADSIINLAFGLFLALLSTLAVLQTSRQQRQLSDLCSGINTVLAISYLEKQIMVETPENKRPSPRSSFDRLSQDMGPLPMPAIPAAAALSRKLLPGTIDFGPQISSQGYSMPAKLPHRTLSHPVVANHDNLTPRRRQMSTY